jgi:hypothetical protein
MNVNNINPFQGLQNAFRSGSGNNSAADNQVVSESPGRSELTVVHDPPFFPIARYQRQDLIKKVKSVAADVEHSANNQGLQNTIFGNISKMSEQKTVNNVTSGKNQPGAILTIKI